MKILHFDPDYSPVQWEVIDGGFHLLFSWDSETMEKFQGSCICTTPKIILKYD